MSEKVLFSIVVPTYNRAEFIGRTINSFLDQTYSNFELIIVDDGSTDNTEQVVNSIKDKRIHYYKKENAERGAARNFGAKKAKGDYINFFDSDDLAYRNHLEEAFKLIEKKDNPKVFALWYDIKSSNEEVIRTPTRFKNINQQLLNGNLLSCNGVFIKREIALENSFSEVRNLSASEDYLLWLQLASRYKIPFSSLATSTITEHDNRSVLNIDPEGLIKRKELMLEFVLNDDAIKKYYGKNIDKILENTYSYIALHLILAGYKKLGLQYLAKTLKSSYSFILTRRFLASLKHILF